MEKKKRITIARIAELAGVSKATASLVLNGRSAEYRIADETRRRIQAVADSCHYQPSIHARALRESRSYTWGLVIPDLTNFGFASIARVLEARCREAGIQLLIACSEDDPLIEQQVVDSLISRQVDGLIVASSGHSDEIYRRIHAQLPVLQLDRHIGESRLPMVISDACKATAELVQAMASEHGNRIYYFGGLLDLSPSRHRLAGYELGLHRAGLAAEPARIRHRDYQPHSGYQLMAELVEELGGLPEALFTASFTLLEGVLRYLNQHGLMDAPLRLCTFDDHDLLDCIPMRIDSVAQDCPALAEGAFTLMQELVRGCSPERTALVLPPRIRWRSRRL
ncbi:substrate-binding domain-containing protein [Aeromonas simiae]|uniref:substrate-binding domain-containing protein n=1 Tax=Aeromonas simiae TaxID=218936 RepID=UPI0005AB1606|nr:substrate-binding domain-containing protein [Aeromonas simiae]MDO2949786.1 LacI family DNA-binding transcriptional regulator [Aeromonas simiae]MDO2951011.1 LacI family DNA-binding transcriptional regulator [Aeromonas simiae]MDO2957126.1 LacI family DNA-binding transcriptional regulator [Aeromonas simiae]